MARKANHRILMYDDWLTLFEAMDDYDLAAIIKAMAAWKLRGEEPGFTDQANGAIWAMIRAKLVEDKAAYEEKCKQNAENRQRSSTNVNDRERPSPIEEKGREEKGREALSNSKVRERTGIELFEALTNDNPLPPEVDEAAREWITYKKERRFSYKESGMKVLINQIRKNVDLYGPEAVVNTIRDSIANGYQGITWDRMNRPKKTGADAVLELLQEGDIFS